MNWPHRLAELRNLMEGSGRFGRVARSQVRYRPAEGSAAAEASQDVELGGVIRDTLALGAIALFAAEDYLAGVGKLLEEADSIFGFMPLTRASMEASARAWWLLDPRIDDRQRATRGLNERLYNLREQMKILAEFSEKGSGYRDREGSVLQLAKDLRLRIVMGGRPQVEWIEAPRTSPTEVVRSLWSTTDLSDVGIATYRFLSGGVHSVFYALKDGFEYVDDPESELEKIGIPRHTSGSVETPAAMALVAWVVAFDAMMTLYGWDWWQWRSWKEHVWKHGVIRGLHHRD